MSEAHNGNPDLDLTEYTASDSNELTAEDFLGGPEILTITEAWPTGNKDRPIAIRFAEKEKVFLPAKTVRRLLSRIWGDDSKRANKTYPGRLLRLYRDPDVQWGGENVGGIRIDGASHINGRQAVSLPVSQHKRRKWTVEPLQVQQPDQGLADRIAHAENVLSEIAPEQLASLQEKAGDMPPGRYLNALADLHKTVIATDKD
jgi:hypothetical protein